VRRPTLDYLKTESGAGFILAGAAAAAVLLAASPYRIHYFAFIDHPEPLRVGAFAVTMTVGGWARQGLMPLFFLVLGMQLKYELLRGELSNLRALALPAFAALGGLVVPTLVYLALARTSGAPGQGWAIGGVTDISLGLSVLALAAPRSAPSLRVLLIGVGLADNLAGVALTALADLGRADVVDLGGAAAVLALLALLSRWRRAPFFFYAAGFVLVWAFVLKARLDTSLAGMACAAATPIGTRRPGQDSTLKFFMESLHPYVAFAVLPLYVFTAAGGGAWSFGGAAGAIPVLLAMWLFKPLGVFGFGLMAATLRFGRRPTGAAWREVLGVAMLSGAGLTVSLYAAELSLAGPAVRSACLLGSALAAGGGALVLRLAQPRQAGLGE